MGNIQFCRCLRKEVNMKSELNTENEFKKVKSEASLIADKLISSASGERKIENMQTNCSVQVSESPENFEKSIYNFLH